DEEKGLEVLVEPGDYVALNVVKPIGGDGRHAGYVRLVFSVCTRVSIGRANSMADPFRPQSSRTEHGSGATTARVVSPWNRATIAPALCLSIRATGAQTLTTGFFAGSLATPLSRAGNGRLLACGHGCSVSLRTYRAVTRS